MHLDHLAYLVQKRMWLFFIPYVFISPIFYYYLFKAPSAPPEKIMPIAFVDANGNTRKLYCGKDDANDINMLALSEKTGKEMLNVLFSFPANKKETAARIATYSKYFSQERDSSIQNFLKSQAEKTLSLADSGASATFNITYISGGYDPKNKNYVVVSDLTQKMVRNGIETTKKFSVDIYLKMTAKERKESEGIILEITSVKLRNIKNES